MARLTISCYTGAMQGRPDAFDSVYDFMMSKGVGHEEANNVASWAQLAGVGEEYELDGFSIRITD